MLLFPATEFGSSCSGSVSSKRSFSGNYFAFSSGARRRASPFPGSTGYSVSGRFLILLRGRGFSGDISGDWLYGPFLIVFYPDPGDQKTKGQLYGISSAVGSHFAPHFNEMETNGAS